MKRSKSIFLAWAMAVVESASYGQNLSTMTPAQAAAAAQAAQSDGQSFGSTSLTTGPTVPSNIANQGMAPGPNNIMGSQYNGTADPALMGLSQNPSLVTTGRAAKTTSVNGFGGYSNTRADQGNQAAYFVTSTPTPIVNIQPTDSIAMTAAAPAIPAGIASSSSVICHTTVTNLPFDPSLDYQCNETYNQYVTSCSLDKTVSIVRVPDCNAAIASNTLGDMSHGPMIKCGTSPTLKVNLGTVPEYKQCHGGGCNSDYYNFTMTIVPGTRSGICLGLQVNYQGRTWVYMCANYDGGTTVTVPPFFDGSYDYIWMGSGRNGGYQSINHMNPGGFLTFTGGHYLRPEVSNGSDINNCTSLSGLLQ